jgi:hypothetical protein
MKKSNIPVIDNEDPVDGTKMIGCLLIGVVILIALGILCTNFVNNTRKKHEKTLSYSYLGAHCTDVSPLCCIL